jgi:hypothetical protein
MLVTRGSVGGTLPNEFGNTFLITTLQYGTNTYLQTAYVVQTGYECWEYRRIYSGTWTAWIGVDSSIKSLNSSISKAQETADAANNSINSLSGDVSNLASTVNSINQTSLPSLSNRCGNLEGRCSNLETNTSYISTTNIPECVTSVTKEEVAHPTVAHFSRFGRACELRLSVYRGGNKSDKCGAGGWWWQGNLGSIAGLYKPGDIRATSSTFIAERALVGCVEENGLVSIKNVATTAIPKNNTAHISFTWIYNGTL